MDSPEFDSNGYPTDATLDRIRTHQSVSSADVKALVAFITEAWHDDGEVRLEDGKLTLVTGGWSGNESIIESLSKNFVFWSRFWESSHRGGLYEFTEVR